MKIQITVKVGDIVSISEIIYCDPTPGQRQKFYDKVLEAAKELRENK